MQLINDSVVEKMMVKCILKPEYKEIAITLLDKLPIGLINNPIPTSILEFTKTFWNEQNSLPTLSLIISNAENKTETKEYIREAIELDTEPSFLESQIHLYYLKLKTRQVLLDAVNKTEAASTIDDFLSVRDSISNGLDTPFRRGGGFSLKIGSEFITETLPERRYFLYPIFPENTITLISGERGAGKSMFIMSAMDKISKGEGWGPWENRYVDGVKVLYFDGEMGQHDLHDRMKQLDVNENFLFYSTPDRNDDDAKGNIANDDYRCAITNMLIENDVKFVCFDNLASLAPGLDENSKKDWDPINQWVIDIRSKGISIVLIHHMGKNKKQRGTSGREDNVDSSIEITMPKNHELSDDLRMCVKWTKFRSKPLDAGNLLRTRIMAYEKQSDGFYHWLFDCDDGEREMLRGLLTDLADGRLSQTALSSKYGIGVNTIKRKKEWMIGKGYLIIVSGEGSRHEKREITGEGREWIESMTF